MALAQDGAEDADDRILVTGTRIAGIEPVGSPVTDLGREDLINSTATTTAEILSELPQVFNLGFNENSYANSGAANVTLGTGINLRGLGTEATLTLLDGRRLPPAGTQGNFFDPSVIPSISVERIEVLADGSSGIYGSDAVGGVVNIMLRKNFQGVELSAEYGVADGLDQVNVAGIIGESWGSGSLVLSGEYYYRTNLAAADRDFYTDDLRPYGGPDLRGNFSNPGTIVADNVFYAIPAGQDGTNLDASDLIAGTQNLRSRYLIADAVPEQERVSLAATFQQDIGDRLEFLAQGFYSKRDGVFSFGAPEVALSVPDTNPFFVHPTDPNADSVTVRYSFLEDFGAAARVASQEVAYITGSLDFEISDSWNVQGFLSYGIDKQRSGRIQLNTGALNAALADPDPATAFNPFGDGSQNAQATLDAIRGEFRVDTDSEVLEFGAIADGPLFELPGGTVRTALGASRQQDDFFQYTPAPAGGGRSINSVFGEVFVPIVGGDMSGPLMKAVNLSAAVRYDAYSDYGDTVNPKFGLTWEVTDSFSLHGSYGTSFRAPGVYDSVSDPFITINDFSDPTSPTGFTRGIFARGPSDTMKPESATTWSIGAEFAPLSVDLQMSLTYFHVDYTDRIVNPNLATLSITNQQLYDFLITYNPSDALVNQFQNGVGFFGVPEDPANLNVIVDARKSNLAALKTDGLEGVIDYRTDIGGGLQLSAGANATYILSFKQALTPNSPLVDVVNTIENPLQFRGRAYLGLRSGGASARLQVNHTGGYDNNSIVPAAPVDSFTSVDLTARYALGDRVMGADLEFWVSARNLFDAAPPFAQYTTLAIDTNMADPIGRMVMIGAKASF